MRTLRTAVAGAILAALVVVPVRGANGVGVGSPVIESPISGAAHYDGFTGPFRVNFEDAPIAEYSYFVDRTPEGGGAPTVVGSPQTVDFQGSITTYELTVAPLPPGTGYAFHVTDGDGHEASLDFTVSSGSPPTCSILLPRAVRMKARSFLVPAKLSATCASLHTTYAAWQARHPVGGFAQTFTFDGVSTDSWRIFDDERTGTYTVRPNYARDEYGEQVPQNTTRLVMKMDSRIRMTASRSGPFLTLRTTTSRYSPRANRVLRWGKRKVVLSYQTCRSCAWKRLTVQTSNRHGVTRYRFRARAVRHYRAKAFGTVSTWAPRPADLTR